MQECAKDTHLKTLCSERNPPCLQVARQSRENSVPVLHLCQTSKIRLRELSLSCLCLVDTALSRAGVNFDLNPHRCKAVAMARQRQGDCAHTDIWRRKRSYFFGHFRVKANVSSDSSWTQHNPTHTSGLFAACLLWLALGGFRAWLSPVSILFGPG
ncbi:hypothetical protein BD289DRAFT_432193 [Coniella lustricola]|uniref:Uncharacterized protein n=1 Tax=Coniella lustricola TaxID=2025994 RepID=A0A2T3AA30_9PEZI|nr:hypothetical protein BD289DRAFT_432193 [Coniella lustricola]